MTTDVNMKETAPKEPESSQHECERTVDMQWPIWTTTMQSAT